jgi:WD40 repeat protein
MKRAIFFISAIIIISSFSSQLLALPEGAVARLGKGIVNEIAFSPDGKILAIASSIGVWLYDVKTFVEIGLLETEEFVRSVAFSPDGSSLASGSGDGTIILWDMKPYIK